MFTLILGLLSTIFGSTGIVGKYLDNKQQLAKATQDYQLALLQSQVEQAKAQIVSETDVQKAKLDSTTASFKQQTFYFLVLPIIISVCLPTYAAIMWDNFNLIPEWFRTLFATVYLTIWGVPVAGGYLTGIFRGISSARADAVATTKGINTSTNNVTLEQPASIQSFSYEGSIDRKIFNDSIRADLGGSMDQKTADMLERALNKAQKNG